MKSLRYVCLLALTASACSFELSRTLAPGELRGTVEVELAGGARAPAAGAVVAFEGSPIAVKADAKGLFVVRNLPAGTYALTISHDADGDGTPDSGLRLGGITLATGADKLGDGRDVGHVLVSSLGAISVTVRKNGEPLAGARVALAGSRELVTGTGGRALFERVLPSSEPYTVAALVTLPDQKLVTKTATVTAKGSVTVDLDAEAAQALQAGTLAGRVRVAGASSATGVTVSVAGREEHADASDDGTWTLSLPGGVYGLVATGPGLRASALTAVIVNGATTVPDIVLPWADATCGLESTDSDGDGIGDACDDCPAFPDEAQPGIPGIPGTCGADRDHDGFPDDKDVCPDKADPAQADGDHDGRGDACDVCPAIADPGQEDADHDGVGDACAGFHPPLSGLCFRGWCWENPRPFGMNVRAVGGVPGTAWFVGARDVAMVTKTGWRAFELDVSDAEISGGAGEWFPNGLRAFSATAADDAWVGGTGGVLAHWDGTQWTRSFGADDPEFRDITGLYAASKNQVFVLSGTAVVEFDGSQNIVERRAASDTDTVLGGSGPEDVCVADQNAVQCWNGSEWNDLGGGHKFFFPNGIAVTPTRIFVTWDGEGPSILDVCDRTPAGCTWNRVEVGNTRLRRVSASGPDDAWVTTEDGAFLHFDGTRWTRLGSGGSLDLGAVVAVSPTEAWASSPKGRVTQWDGHAWHEASGLDAPALVTGSVAPNGDAWAIGADGVLYRTVGGKLVGQDLGTARRALSVWAAAADDVWVVGEGGLAKRLVGGAWVDQAVAVRAPGHEVAYGLVTGSGPADVWISGESSVFHLESGAFVESSIPAGDSATPSGAVAIAPVNADLAFAVTYPGEPMMRWERGAGWTRDPGLATRVARAAIWVQGTEGWAGGVEGQMYHYGPGGWTVDGLPTESEPISIWGAGPTDVWALASDGLYHYGADSEWTQVPGTAGQGGFVAGRSKTDAWIFGDVTAHFDGTRWNTVAAPAQFSSDVGHLRASTGQVLAGGTHGLAWVRGDGQWEAKPVPGRATVKGTWATSATAAWAAADHLYLLGPAGWTDAGPETGHGFHDVVARGPNDVFAANSGVYRMAPTWQDISQDVPRNDGAGPWAAAGRIVATANPAGAVEIFDGTAWTDEVLPMSMIEYSTKRFDAIAATADGTGALSELWVGGGQMPQDTWECGLAHRKAGGWERISMPDGPGQDGRVFSLATGDTGGVWGLVTDTYENTTWLLRVPDGASAADLAKVPDGFKPKSLGMTGTTLLMGGANGAIVRHPDDGA